MAQVRSWAGLDVHRASVLAATMDRAGGELGVRRLSGETREVVAFCAGLPGLTRVAYEAGPTGFGLARALRAADIECVVAAPGKIERPAGDRVKTDQRDAERLLRLLMIDALHPVRVPSNEEEALSSSCGRGAQSARTTRPGRARAAGARTWRIAGRWGCRRSRFVTGGVRPSVTTTYAED
jgi:transposase